MLCRTGSARSAFDGGSRPRSLICMPWIMPRCNSACSDFRSKGCSKMPRVIISSKLLKPILLPDSYKDRGLQGPRAGGVGGVGEGSILAATTTCIPAVDGKSSSPPPPAYCCFPMPCHARDKGALDLGVLTSSRPRHASPDPRRSSCQRSAGMWNIPGTGYRVQTGTGILEPTPCFKRTGKPERGAPQGPLD